MRIYIVSRKNVKWDQYGSVCVIADDAKTARQTAKDWVDKKSSAFEKPYSDDFVDPKKSTLKLIKSDGPVVALASFNAG